MSRKIKYGIKSRVWICTEDGTFLGEGRVNLLLKIDEFGSISKAAKEMKMSYKKAWELVNSMNSQSKSPLVNRSIGGKGGGGTKLTKEGQEAIAIFVKINEETKQFLDQKLKEVNL